MTSRWMQKPPLDVENRMPFRWGREHISHSRGESPYFHTLAWVQLQHFQAKLTGQTATCPKNEVTVVMVKAVTVKVYEATLICCMYLILPTIL